MDPQSRVLLWIRHREQITREGTCAGGLKAKAGLHTSGTGQGGPEAEHNQGCGNEEPSVHRLSFLY